MADRSPRPGRRIVSVCVFLADSGKAGTLRVHPPWPCARTRQSASLPKILLNRPHPRSIFCLTGRHLALWSRTWSRKRMRMASPIEDGDWPLAAACNGANNKVYTGIIEQREVNLFRWLLLPKFMPGLIAWLTGFDRLKLEGHRKILRERKDKS